MEGKSMKTISKRIKIIIGVIGGVLLLLILAAAVLLTNPKLQMKLMTKYVMQNLQNYNWSALQIEDPVKPTLSASIGEDKEESVEGFYGYLKDSAQKMQWDLTEVNPQELTATLDVQYVDGNDFVTAYGNGMGDYIVKALDDGTMQESDLSNPLGAISDEDNSAIIEAAKEEVNKQDAKYVNSSLTIHFQKQGPLYIPTGTSDEVNDIASSNLTKSMDNITKVVTARMLPQIVDKVFYSIQTFDEEKLKSYTGKSFSEMLGISKDVPLYDVIMDYIKNCASKMEYTVGSYDEKSASIQVTCSYMDSQNVIDAYTKSLTAYALKHWTSPVPGAKESAKLFKEAAENAEEKRDEKIVTITFNPKDYSQFEISDEIKDVVTANLYHELGLNN